MGTVLKLDGAHRSARNNPRLFKNTADVIARLNPGQPVYLFNRQRLARRVREFRAGFPGTVAYAVKANTRKRILRTLAGQGIGNFDVASIAEVSLLRSLNPGATIHYNNPVKSHASITAAYNEYGVRSFALDDAFELEKIVSACADPARLLLSVRFKLPTHQAAFDFGSKFGTTPERAAELLCAISRTGARAALTFHPGSQCADPEEYRRYIRAAAQIGKDAGVDLAQLNVGGGFPEYYSNNSPAPLARYFETVRQAILESFGEGAPPVMCEPGRAMVASSVSLLCRVIHVRSDGHTAFINDGVYGGLQEQNLTDFRLPLLVWRNGGQVRHSQKAFEVFGPTCDPSDRLPRKLDLPADLRTDDYLEFGLVGAYGSATATTFNGFPSQQYVDVETA